MVVLLSEGAIIGLAVVGVVVLLAIIFACWWISTSNWFKRAKVKVDEANSGIDVALTKRYDLLTKLLASVKGYAKHEYETLSQVIAMRSGNNIKDLSLEEKSALNSQLSQVQKGINIVMEQYPQLKADTQFTNLQNQTADCEEQLQAARRVYNSNVSGFNQKRVSFPSSMVANAIGFRQDLEFFKAEEEKRKDVTFDF
mgnify:CR=1 FL=1